MKRSPDSMKWSGSMVGFPSGLRSRLLSRCALKTPPCDVCLHQQLVLTPNIPSILPFSASEVGVFLLFLLLGCSLIDKHLLWEGEHENASGVPSFPLLFPWRPVTCQRGASSRATAPSPDRPLLSGFFFCISCWLSLATSNVGLSWQPFSTKWSSSAWNCGGTRTGLAGINENGFAACQKRHENITHYIKRCFGADLTLRSVKLWFTYSPVSGLSVNYYFFLMGMRVELGENPCASYCRLSGRETPLPADVYETRRDDDGADRTNNHQNHKEFAVVAALLTGREGAADSRTEVLDTNLITKIINTRWQTDKQPEISPTKSLKLGFGKTAGGNLTVTAHPSTHPSIPSPWGSRMC